MRKYLSKIISLVILILFYVFFVKCPFRKILGIPCPSCGLTRAFIFLLKLDFKKSFYMHPMLIFVLVALILILLNDKSNIFKNKKKKFMDIYIFLVSILFFAVYIFRLLNNSIPF